jgi:hypothetical protein
MLGWAGAYEARVSSRCIVKWGGGFICFYGREKLPALRLKQDKYGFSFTSAPLRISSLYITTLAAFERSEPIKY